MEDQVFVEEKSPGDVRIAVIGESAARGYPQPRTLAASSFLEEMLARAAPARQHASRRRSVPGTSMYTACSAAAMLHSLAESALVDGTVGVFLDNTSAQFPNVQDTSRDVDFVDLEHDGDPDLFVSNSSTTSNQT